MGSIPGWGTKIPQAVCPINKTLKKFFFFRFLFNTKNILYRETVKKTSRFCCRFTMHKCMVLESENSQLVLETGPIHPLD